jgi:hypothetical protein
MYNVLYGLCFVRCPRVAEALAEAQALAKAGYCLNTKAFRLSEGFLYLKKQNEDELLR